MYSDTNHRGLGIGSHQSRENDMYRSQIKAWEPAPSCGHRRLGQAREVASG